MSKESGAASPIQSYILKLQCPDQVGIVAAVSGFLVEKNCNIVRSSQFEDQRSRWFFMRTCFDAGPGTPGIEELQHKFAEIGSAYGMEWSLYSRETKQNLLILVSKTSHCLVDLLHRFQVGQLDVNIPAIVSNHEILRPLCDFYQIPFVHLPVNSENKRKQERALSKLIEDNEIDLVVLARYMQILSDEFCALYQGRIINIHHSFLPSFKGARPYHQAHERGVKIIGATAHYVTADLDEGPIIDQEVRHITHEHTPEDLVQIGSDIEAYTLSRAVKAHVEHRILMDGARTVVFQ